MSSVSAREGLAPSDQQLVRRAGRGDVAAFDALVASRVGRCYRLAWSILANDADAADATQDAFVAAWRELPRLRDPAAFDGWLNRIVANAARMARRHRVRLREIQMPSTTETGNVPDPASGAVSSPTADSFDGIVERDAIGRAFDRLRPEDRVILVLHHIEDRPVAEIARSLGIPVGTTKWRLHAARRALEREMEVEA